MPRLDPFKALSPSERRSCHGERKISRISPHKSHFYEQVTDVKVGPSLLIRVFVSLILVSLRRMLLSTVFLCAL